MQNIKLHTIKHKNLTKYLFLLPSLFLLLIVDNKESHKILLVNGNKSLFLYSCATRLMPISIRPFIYNGGLNNGGLSFGISFCHPTNNSRIPIFKF